MSSETKFRNGDLVILSPGLEFFTYDAYSDEFYWVSRDAEYCTRQSAPTALKSDIIERGTVLVNLEDAKDIYRMSQPDV